MDGLRWTVGLLLCVCLLAVRLSGKNAPPPKEDSTSLEDDIVRGADEELRKNDHQGSFAIELIGPDGKSIEPDRFQRGIPGELAVSDFPHIFTLDGRALFTAGTTLESTAAASGDVSVFTTSPAEDANGAVYVARSTANLPPGHYTIEPFHLEFEVGQSVTSRQSALLVKGKTLAIRTAPILFRAQDEKGKPRPASGIHVQFGKTDLLEHLTQAETPGAFVSLKLYLPVGLEYQSSFGRIWIDDNGTVHATDLTSGVTFENGTLTQKVSDGQSGTRERVHRGYWLLSHNLRRVFKRPEVARFDVIAAGELPAADLAVIAQAGESQVSIGRLSMPEIAAGSTDARLLCLDTAALPPGKYRLSLKDPKAHPFDFEVVDLLPTTPLFLFTINSCGESSFSVDSAGLDQLSAAHLRCWSSYGFGGILQAPKAEPAMPYPPAPAGAPAELRRQYTKGRAILDDSLRHGLITFDYENRRLGWYNEGLAFHHSHPMSVDRMVRRVQIFAEELEDYPALAGMSYTWFPSLGGYVEGGVCTDPFFATRMEILRKKVKARTGLEPLTEAQSKQLDADPSSSRALADQQRSYWRSEQKMGWADTFALYNQKLREVRQDLIATTSENAGHDAGKSLADMASAHDAMTFESYTDFGDWPMSAGFTTDWGHGIATGKPMWQAVESSQSEPAICAKQFYKFARGAEGIAVGIPEPGHERVVAKRARTNRFLERYGPLVTDWSADTQVAVCVSEIQYAEYDAHALHSHLTRLGYGPIILSERTLEQSGVPMNLKAVLIPNLKRPFSDKAENALLQFMSRGGKVMLVGETSLPITGAIRVTAPLKNLFELDGFAAHLPFFAEFKKVRPALEKALADIGLSPRNGNDPERAVILPSTSAGIHYVTVIASSVNSKDTDFVPAEKIPVRVGGAKQVINLVTGEPAPAQDGAVRIDLTSEPVAFLALLDAAPRRLTLHHPKSVTAGESVTAWADLDLPQGQRAPVEYQISDGSGKTRACFYRLSGESSAVKYQTALIEPAGPWTIVATELLTGLTARSTFTLNAASSIIAVKEAARVYLPHPDRIRSYLSHAGPIRIVVEESQAQLLPEAERLATALKNQGRQAAVQKVGDSAYETYWLHWMPTAADQATMARIEAGEVVGYRGSLRPYISSAKRAMVPEKGGWSDIDPPYILRTDVVVFSGGRIADSLNSLTDWGASANFPGKGSGLLEVCLSPFWANLDALAIVSNDEAGRHASIDRLLRLIQKNGIVDETPEAAAAIKTSDASEVRPSTDRIRLETPLKGFVPPTISQSLCASPDGWAAIGTKTSSYLVSPEGMVRTLPRVDTPLQIRPGGTVFGGIQTVVRRDPSWNFPTAWTIRVVRYDQNGAGKAFDLPEPLSPGDQFDGWDQGFIASADGKTYFSGRDGGAFFLTDLTEQTFLSNIDALRDLRFCEQVRAPVSVTAAQFSSDGAFVAYTTGTHPTGYGGMMGPPANPFATALRVIDTRTSQTVWQASAGTLSDSTYSSVGGCLAVSSKARRVALINFNQEAVLFDERGKEIARKSIFDWKSHHASRDNPKPMRCELNADGSIGLLASDGHVLLIDDKGTTLSSSLVPALNDVRLASDGSGFFVADQDGQVSAFDVAGKFKWKLQTRGERPYLAVTDRAVLIADGAGELLTVDMKGHVARSIDFQNRSETPTAPAVELLNGPPLYREPTSLQTLKPDPKPLFTWEASGPAENRFGKTFHTVSAAVQCSARREGPKLVHLVYRIGRESFTVTLSGGGKSLPFVLDLPTPQYRTVDLPFDAAPELQVSVAPCPGLGIAELSIYGFHFPGSNGLYVRPAGSASDVDGLEARKPDKDDADLILDDKDPASVARSVRGKMKNVAIFANNPDPDQVEGHYLRATGNALDCFDGLKWLDGQPKSWCRGAAAPFGARILVDLNHVARPRLCVTYARTLKQSELMSGIAILKGKKSDFVLGESAGPDALLHEPRVIGSAMDNDQFFNVFDLKGVDVEALGVYGFSREGKELGLSEIELYE